MPVKYATPDQFTAAYSYSGVSSAALDTHWLVEGALRVNELLGGHYTVPFDADNHTARSLSIEFARMALLERTRKKDDAEEIGKSVMARVEALTDGGRPMYSDSGDTIYPSKASNNAFSTGQGFKSVFDMRDAEQQRVDPDLLKDERDRDVS